MFNSNKRILVKFFLLFTLIAGVAFVETDVKAKTYCPYEPAYKCCSPTEPCPFPYSCTYGACVCDCPDSFGNCPSSCA